MAKTPIEKFNMIIYFENLIVGLHVLYALDIHVKFCTNRILFTIRSKNLFFIRNFRLLKLQI